MGDFTFTDSQNADHPAPNFVHLAANGSTLAKTGSGILQALVINTPGGSSNIVTIYDGTSAGGTVIGIYGTTVAAARLPINLQFRIGLFIVVATGTAADLTVTFF